jgi:cell division protein FtsI (penicillin-binding protein 3)
MDDGGPPLVARPRRSPARLKAIFPDLDEVRGRAPARSGKAGYLRRRVLPEDANKV